MQFDTKTNTHYFVSNFTDSLEINFETHKQSQKVATDIILQTNSIVEKADLTQTQMNGKISNYICFCSVTSLILCLLQM